MLRFEASRPMVIARRIAGRNIDMELAPVVPERSVNTHLRIDVEVVST